MQNQTDSPKIDKSTLPWLVLGAIIVGIAGFTLWSTFNTNSEPISMHESVSVPDFTLTNQQAQSFGLTNLEGKIWVANFIFTNCPTICPKMTQKMAELQTEFEDKPVYFVSFTVDPERDTAEVLSEYAKRYAADEERWHFLTGNKQQIYQLANEGFRLAASPHGNGFPHSSKFALVRPDGKVHDYYDSQYSLIQSKATLKKLSSDIRTLLNK